MRQHKDESQVAKAMTMETAQEQDLAFERLRLLGDYQHNCDVLALGEGELIVVRMPKKVEEGIAANFLPCPSCMGFFMGSELWRHRQNCPHRSQEATPKWSRVQQEAKLLLPTTVLSTKEVKKSLYDNVLSSMKNDEIAAIARKDALIINFGAAIFEKVGTKNINYVSQRMRQLARLLQTLRKKDEAANFEEFIDTARFDDLVAAVRDLCGFQEESRLDIDVPSLALKLGHSIKQCAQVLKSSSLTKKDEAAIRECQNFIDLFEAEWAIKISSRSLASLGSKKQNKVEILPLAGDLMLLKNHLEKKMADLSKILNEGEKTQTAAGHWSSLAKTTLARIIIFNKRRLGETATLQIGQFQSRPNWASCSTALKASLTALEKRLCER